MDQYGRGTRLIQLLKSTMQTKKSDCLTQRLSYSQRRNEVLGVYNSPTAYQMRAALTHKLCQSAEKLVLIEGIVLVHSAAGPYRNYNCSHHRISEITLAWTRNQRIFWVGKDPKGSQCPTLKWMALTGIKPITLTLLAQWSNQLS